MTSIIYLYFGSLVSMDKTEIIKTHEKLTLMIYQFYHLKTAVRFTPPAPKTRPDLEKTRNFEKLIDVDGLMQASGMALKLL